MNYTIFKMDFCEKKKIFLIAIFLLRILESIIEIMNFYKKRVGERLV